VMDILISMCRDVTVILYLRIGFIFYVMYGRNWKKDEFVCIDRLYYTDEIEKR